MKKSILVLASCLGILLAAGSASADWEEGRSPAQPYAGVPEVNLDETMGYIMLYPREKMPAEHFCGALEIYLPREDITASDGTLTLYHDKDKIASVSFVDSEEVVIRPLDEEELDGLMWGGGTCIEIHLPVSLTMGENYYVTMTEGCFTAADGKVKSLPADGKDTWIPVVTGDFGVNGLYYSVGSGEEAEGETEAEGPSEAEEPENIEYTIAPGAGDELTFDLLMGGDAVSAVVYSENGSVEFPVSEFTESGPVRGYVAGSDVSWGIVFLDKNGDVLDVIDF